MSKIKLKIKKGDKVIIIAGKDKGKKGTVISVDPTKMKLIISGINNVICHKKPTQLNPEGGKVTKEMPLHYSNIQLLDPKVDLPTRIGYKFLDDGKKIRIALRSGEIIDNV